MNSLPRQRKLPQISAAIISRGLVYESRLMRVAQRPAMFGGLLSRFVSQTGTKGLALYICSPSSPSLVFFPGGGGVG